MGEVPLYRVGIDASFAVSGLGVRGWDRVGMDEAVILLGRAPISLGGS